VRTLLLLCVACVSLWAAYRHTNALIDEDSPYLQQHAHNPVNWYPWGEAAFEKARKEHKFIFLSIGYSTCHWCHEMEKESFTDETVATLLNKDFVSIKVDREEYPQIDKKYQQLYLSFWGKRGGWPLSVFMTPEGKVFHLGTYIPKEEGYGSKGLLQMLPAFASLKQHPDRLKTLTDKYMAATGKGIPQKLFKAPVTKGWMHATVSAIAKTFDRKNGGFGTRPKFPEASKIGLLLDIYRLNGNHTAYEMAKMTLDKMALGGIYDQIGGGFFRYTTDAQWQSPHYEKMLYANAEMIPLYVAMFEETKHPFYKKVAAETIASMQIHYMRDGLYFSASDADSDGEEGGYFIYRYEAVKEALIQKGMDAKRVEKALAYLGIEEDGNVDGELSHAHIAGTVKPAGLEKVKTYLRSLREQRTFPFVDKKIITAWNAMMVKALFVASKIDPAYLEDAQKSLSSLWKLMRRGDTLYHQVLWGKRPKQKALLEDYAFLCDACIEGYERTFDPVYLKRAGTLGREAVATFYRKGRWYLSADRVKTVADFDDRYYTSPLSTMLASLLKLAALSEKMQYLKVVRESIAQGGAVLQAHPERAPKLADVYLRLTYGDVIIHADKTLLQNARKAIDAIRYPFVLSKVERSSEYLACRINSCFAHDGNITALIEKIEKAVRQYADDE